MRISRPIHSMSSMRIACGRRSKYAPTEVEIPPLDPDECYEDAALV